MQRHSTHWKCQRERDGEHGLGRCVALDPSCPRTTTLPPCAPLSSEAGVWSSHFSPGQTAHGNASTCSLSDTSYKVRRIVFVRAPNWNHPNSLQLLNEERNCSICTLRHTISNKNELPAITCKVKDESYKRDAEEYTLHTSIHVKFKERHN